MTAQNFQQETLDVQARQILAYKKSGGVKLGPWTSHLFIPILDI